MMVIIVSRRSQISSASVNDELLASLSKSDEKPYVGLFLFERRHMENEDNFLNYTFDDLFAAAEGGDKEKDFDVDDWKKKKQELRQMVFDLVDQAAMHAVSSPTQYQKFLDVWARFGSRYSVNNLLLICKQNPEATELQGYSEWRMRGAPVKKKESETYILTSTPKEDGKGVYYDVKKVFDITQTKQLNAKDKEDPVLPTYDERTLMKALVDASPVKIVGNDTRLDADEMAVYDENDKAIHVRMGVKDAPELFRQLAQEIVLAHLTLGKETESVDICFLSHSASFLLAKAYRVDTPKDSYSWHDVRQSFGDLTPVSIKGGINQLKDVYEKVRYQMDSHLGARP